MVWAVLGRRIDPSDVKVLILAGGSNDKLNPIAGNMPKTLIKILGRPLVFHVVDKLTKSGYGSYVIVTDRPDETRTLLNHNIKTSTTVNVVGQYDAGIGPAIVSGYRAINPEPDELILLVYGDIVIKDNAYRAILSSYNEYIDRKNIGGVFLAVVEEPLESHGILYVDESNFIKRVLPTKQSNYTPRYISGGIYLIKGSFFELIEKYGSVIYALNEYVARNRVIAYYWKSYWVNVGTPWDILVASYYLLKDVGKSIISPSANVSHTATLDGIVVIDDDVEIDHFSIIKGPVYIGRNTFVGAHSFIRNYTSLEEGSIIGSYTEINRSVIMDKATVGRGSYIGYSILAPQSVIEPGVITKNVIHTINEKDQSHEINKNINKRGEYAKIGCVVSRGSRVKAGTVIEPGAVI